MDLFPLLIAGFVMLVVVLVVLGVSQLQGGSGKVLTRRLEHYGQEQPTAVKTATGAVLRDVDHGRLGPFAGLLSGSHGVRSTAIELERAGIPLRVGEFMTIRFALAIVLFLAALMLMSGGMMAFVVAVGLGAFGYVLPRWYVGSRRRGRQTRICSQLVEMITLVSTSLKSGYGLMKSFEFAAEQLKPPLSTELKRTLQDASLGQGAEGALEALAERISSPDLDLVITAVKIHKTVGGNLAEVLDSVAYTMRERDRLRGEVKTLTSQQRMSGIIVGSLPIFVGLLFLVVNPDYMAPLFNETAGRMILLTAVGMEVLGFLAIKAILSFEV